MRTAALLLPLLFLACATADFEPIPVESGEETPGAFDPEKAVVPIPDHERLTYSGIWRGVPVGEGVFTFNREGDVYETTARVDTTGLLSLFYSLAIEVEAKTGVADLLSRRFTLESEEKSVDVHFDPESGRILSIIRKGEKIEKVNFKNPGTLDPLGAIYALRRSPLEPGRGYVTDLFSEYHMYRAAARVMRRERISVGAGEFETILVRVDIRRYRDGVLDATGRPAAIWFTDDSARIPVRIDAETKIGRIRLELESYAEGEASRGSRGP